MNSAEVGMEDKSESSSSGGLLGLLFWSSLGWSYRRSCREEIRQGKAPPESIDALLEICANPWTPRKVAVARFRQLAFLASKEALSVLEQNSRLRESLTHDDWLSLLQHPSSEVRLGAIRLLPAAEQQLLKSVPTTPGQSWKDEHRRETTIQEKVAVIEKAYVLAPFQSLPTTEWPISFRTWAEREPGKAVQWLEENQGKMLSFLRPVDLFPLFEQRDAEVRSRAFAALHLLHRAPSSEPSTLQESSVQGSVSREIRS